MFSVPATAPHDTIAAIITLLLALMWLRIMDAIAIRGWLDPKISRKLIHIGTGPLFVLCWPWFSNNSSARYFAALVPLSITLQFVAIGLGWLHAPATVQSTTRTGNPQEMLRGPLYYGLVFIVCTLIFWRTSPVGIVALMAMCGGDGLADIVGRRFGRHKLPFNTQKSWAGSAAMWGGSVLLATAMLVWFRTLGLLSPAQPIESVMAAIAAIAFVATLIEALPFPDIDNLTLSGVAILLGMWWL